MKTNLPPIVQKALPFLIMGISIVFAFALIMLLAYLVMWGILIGGILAAGSFVYQKCFAPKRIKRKQGRIIEHDPI